MYRVDIILIGCDLCLFRFAEYCCTLRCQGVRTTYTDLWTALRTNETFTTYIMHTTVISHHNLCSFSTVMDREKTGIQTDKQTDRQAAYNTSLL